jgi:hypothetical protein
VTDLTARQRQAAGRPGVSDPAAAATGARRLWEAVTGLVGGVVGLVPHVLHHVGFLAGTGLVAGSGGTALFGAVGLLASVPMLLRLRRRFGTWRAPAVAIAVFAAMFALSAFVIGPAISGGGAARSPNVEHDVHHE